MSTESELQAKYDAAVRDWEATQQATEAAWKERYEKWKLVNQQPKDSREWHLAEAERWKADIILIEQYEQECAAECEKCAIAVELVVHRHGVNSKAAQIATHRLELTRTKEMKWDWWSLYCTEWYKLYYKGRQLHYQLKAEECHAAAAELWKAKDEFHSRILNESNGDAFYNAWKAANAAMDKWENNDNRTDWDAAKPKYDAALNTWNAFKPKGDAYAKALETKLNEYIKKLPIAFFVHEHIQVLIQKLEEDNKQKTQEINKLKKEICELKNSDAQNKKDISELKNDSEQYKKDISELKNDSEQYKKDITELKNDSEQYKKDISELKNDSEQYKNDISELKNDSQQYKKDITELKNDSEQYKKDISELKNDAEQKRRRIRKLEDGGEKKCEEIRGVKSEIKHNVKEMCELKGTMGGMTECMNALAQGIHTLLRGQCQYIAESEATARTAVEREWQLWCEHTMTERRTLQESEAAARHQYEQLYDFDE